MKDQYSTYLCKPTAADILLRYIGSPLHATTKDAAFKRLIDEVKPAYVLIRRDGGIIADIIIGAPASKEIKPSFIFIKSPPKKSFWQKLKSFFY